MDVIEELGVGGMRFIQDKALFKFGTDAVLLAHFCHLSKNAQICDLGTGTGILPVLLCGLYPGVRVDGVEIQKDAAVLAHENIKLNGLLDRVHIYQNDLREIKGVLPAGMYDAVLTNPPYMKVGHGKQNSNPAFAIARSEISCDMNDVCRAAAWLLRTGGNFFIVHRPERLCDVFYAMRQVNIEPKRLRLAYPDVAHPPSLIIVQGKKGAAPGIKTEKPFIINNSGSTFSLKDGETH